MSVALYILVEKKQSRTKTEKKKETPPVVPVQPFSHHDASLSLSLSK